MEGAWSETDMMAIGGGKGGEGGIEVRLTRREGGNERERKNAGQREIGRGPGRHLLKSRSFCRHSTLTGSRVEEVYPLSCCLTCARGGERKCVCV